MRIQRAPREKVALFLVFGVGVFSMVSSIVRLYSIRIFTQSTDPVRDAIPVNLWSIIEVNVGIVCASVPALKPLFSGGQRARTSQALGGSSGNFQGQYPYASNKSALSNNSSGMPGTPSEARINSSFSGIGGRNKSSSTSNNNNNNNTRNSYNMKSLSSTVRSLGGSGGNGGGGGAGDRGVGGGGNIHKETITRDDESTENILPPDDETVYQGELEGHHSVRIGDSKV